MGNDGKKKGFYRPGEVPAEPEKSTAASYNNEKKKGFYRPGEDFSKTEKSPSSMSGEIRLSKRSRQNETAPVQKASPEYTSSFTPVTEHSPIPESNPVPARPVSDMHTKQSTQRKAQLDRQHNPLNNSDPKFTKKQGVRFESVLLVIALLIGIAAIGLGGGVLFAKYLGGDHTHIFPKFASHGNTDNIITTEQIKAAQITYNTIIAEADKLTEKYCNSNNEVTIDDLPKLLKEVAQYANELKNTGVISSFSYSDGDTCVYMQIDDWLNILYDPIVDGYMAGGLDRGFQIITLEPNASAIEMYFNYVTTGAEGADQAAQMVENSFDNFYFSTNLDNKNVTIEAFVNLPQDSIIIFSGHGGYTSEVGGVLFTGVNAWDKDLISKYCEAGSRAVCFNKKGQAYLTSEFFDRYVKDEQYNGNLFYLGSCSSFQDARLVQSIWDKGARAIVGNSNSVYIRYNFRMIASFFEGLTSKDESGKYRTISEALEYAQNIHGITDGNICQVVACFRDDFRLSEMGSTPEADHFTDTSSQTLPITAPIHFECVHMQAGRRRQLTLNPDGSFTCQYDGWSSPFAYTIKYAGNMSDITKKSDYIYSFNLKDINIISSENVPDDLTPLDPKAGTGNSFELYLPGFETKGSAVQAAKQSYQSGQSFGEAIDQLSQKIDKGKALAAGEYILLDSEIGTVYLSAGNISRETGSTTSGEERGDSKNDSPNVLYLSKMNRARKKTKSWVETLYSSGEGQSSLINNLTYGTLMDWDNDGVDELFLCYGEPNTWYFSGEIGIYDIKDKKVTAILEDVESEVVFGAAGEEGAAGLTFYQGKAAVFAYSTHSYTSSSPEDEYMTISCKFTLWDASNGHILHKANISCDGHRLRYELDGKNITESDFLELIKECSSLAFSPKAPMLAFRNEIETLSIDELIALIS